MTDSMLDSKSRTRLLKSLEDMRSGASNNGVPERKFDRAAFEQLRAAMSRKKGRAAVKVIN